MMSKQKYLAVVLLLLIVFDVLGIYILIRHSALFRIIDVTNINDPSIGHQASRMSFEEQKTLLRDLMEAGLDKFKGEQQVLEVMKWVMNQVNKVEVYFGTPYDALKYARQGGGLSCGPMAEIFKESLNLLGIKARKVLLVRSFFDKYDTHALVEVFINNKWQIYDPTFNVSFKSLTNKNLLSAQEMKEALIKGKFNEVKPIFYGEVDYPARLEKYYIHYLPLYNNVFILHEIDTSLWKKLPPLRYFYGPVFIYQSFSKSKEGPLFVVMHKDMYLVFILILPVLIIAMASIIVARIVRHYLQIKIK